MDSPYVTKRSPANEWNVINSIGVVAWTFSKEMADTIASALNASATPADPDAGLSEGARKLIAKIRELDRSDPVGAELMVLTPQFVRVQLGREGGAA